MKNSVFFIESDFDCRIEDAAVVRSPFKMHNKFKRFIANGYYGLRLALAPRRALVIAPWGLFWIPGLLNLWRLKRFRIISLSCDTFLSRKTMECREKSFLSKIKYLLAAKTSPLVESFIFCSEIVKEQALAFGIAPKQCAGFFREWIRDEKRYEQFKTFTPATEKNNFLFIGHCYGIMQKRVDLLVEAFVAIKAAHPDATLTVIGRGWPEFFGQEKVEELKKSDIAFTGETYNIDRFLRDSAFYIHPGELEGFGVSVIEAMIAGLIPLVSLQTGARDAAVQVDSRLLFELSIEAIEKEISWAIDLSKSEREALSKKSREVGATYHSSKSLPALREELIKIINS